MNCRSPDYWCRRLNVVNGIFKSEKSFKGPDFPELLKEIHQFFLNRKYSHTMEEFFSHKFVQLDPDLFCSIMFELRCTKFRIVQKAIVESSFDAFSFNLWCNKYDVLFVVEFSHIDGYEVTLSL